MTIATRIREIDILKFIIDHIDNDSIEMVFNTETFIPEYNFYDLSPFPVKISKEMLEDIISNPEHYRKFIINE